MHNTIELLYETIDKEHHEIVSNTKTREEAIRTVCKLQSMIERSQYKIDQLHIELKNLQSLNGPAKMGSDNGCAVSANVSDSPLTKIRDR